MASLINMYLNDLEHSLRTGVGVRRKKRILCEVEEHLHESVQHYQQLGLPIEEAEHTAIASFGSPSVIAHQFATDIAASSVSMMSKVMLSTVICLQLVTQFGYHSLPLAARPRNIMTNQSLAWMVNLYSFAFLAALTACLYALWLVYRSRWGAMTPGEIQRVVTVLALALVALVVAGVTTSVFVFRLPGSPSFPLQAGLSASGLLATLIGGIFAFQAGLRYAALRTLTIKCANNP